MHPTDKAPNKEQSLDFQIHWDILINLLILFKKPFAAEWPGGEGIWPPMPQATLN